jgi:hypothetical protein
LYSISSDRALCRWKHTLHNQSAAREDRALFLCAGWVTASVRVLTWKRLSGDQKGPPTSEKPDRKRHARKARTVMCCVISVSGNSGAFVVKHRSLPKTLYHERDRLPAVSCFCAVADVFLCVGMVTNLLFTKFFSFCN